ncbi:MAG: 50S ribosomal protein L29 [Candidatus Pacearchaeota archaeon]
MAILRKKEIKNMSEKDIEEKIKELRIELVKRYAPANKSSKIKAKEIKKAIARLLTAQKLMLKK